MTNLIVICGYTGVGKTTIARLIAKEKNYLHIRGSEVARELKEKPPEIWPYDFRVKKYKKMFDKAEASLEKGNSVILDAVFDLQEFRDGAKKIADKTRSKYVLIEVICDEDVVKKRIEERYKMNPNSPHFEIHEKRKKEFEPIKEPHYIINNSSGNLEKKISEIISKLK